jgi:hypothetical protein
MEETLNSVDGQDLQVLSFHCLDWQPNFKFCRCRYKKMMMKTTFQGFTKDYKNPK